jgi:hypothetical protein
MNSFWNELSECDFRFRIKKLNLGIFDGIKLKQ